MPATHRWPDVKSGPAAGRDENALPRTLLRLQKDPAHRRKSKPSSLSAGPSETRSGQPRTQGTTRPGLSYFSPPHRQVRQGPAGCAGRPRFRAAPDDLFRSTGGRNRRGGGSGRGRRYCRGCPRRKATHFKLFPGVRAERRAQRWPGRSGPGPVDSGWSGMGAGPGRRSSEAVPSISMRSQPKQAPGPAPGAIACLFTRPCADDTAW